MLTFPTERVAQDPKNSESRRAFLMPKAGGPDVLPICEILAAAYQARPNERDRQTRNRENEADRGYPWVSLVLGSGCVERLHLVPGEERTRVPHRHLPDLVKRALTGPRYPPFADNTGIYQGDLADLGYEFVASLLRDRLDESPQEPAPESASISREEEPAIARTAALCLLAALLTRLYYESRVAMMSAPVTRGEEIVEAADDDADHPIHRYRNEIRKLRRQIMDSLGEDDGALEALLKSVAADLGDNRLALLNVQLLTEIAWYHLTRGLDAYPGWSDMLAGLAIRQERSLSRYADKYGPRPLYDTFLGVSDAVAGVFERATKKSWALVHDSRTTSTTQDRADLHAAAARLLARQADLHATASRSAKPPPPSVLVTTFDLELEMALWNLGAPFIVALPVHVQVEGVDEVVSCWLGRVVTPFQSDPSTELQALREAGSVDDWFVMSAATPWGPSTTTATGKPIGRLPHPIVVRLSGSPLMSLPVLGSQAFVPLHNQLQEYLVSYLTTLNSGAKTPEERRENLRLHAAVIVDEYASLRQSLSELYRFYGESELRQGLPDAVTDGSSDAFARYWMLLGVQLGDPGMRQRFSSQLLSPLLFGRQQSPPKPAGVAVTKRVDDVLARDLLRWHGFDVVRAKCEEFTEDVLHCLKHLEVSPPAAGYTRSGESCKVDALLARQQELAGKQTGDGA